MKNEKIVIVSGYFDPLHIGHLEYFELSKKLGDKLVVIVNNNEQCKLKKGEYFMTEKDRLEIVFALGIVDEVLISSDTDGSVTQTQEFSITVTQCFGIVVSVDKTTDSANPGASSDFTVSISCKL